MIIKRKLYTETPVDNRNREGRIAKNIGLVTAGTGLTILGVNQHKLNNIKNTKFKMPDYDPSKDEYLQRFKDKLKSGKESIIGARIKISNEALLDPRMKSFDHYVKAAEDHFGEALWDKYDPKEVVKKFDPKLKGASAEDALYKGKNALSWSFTRDNLANYKEIASNTLKDKAKNLDIEESKGALREFRKNKAANLKKIKNAKYLALGAAGVGSALYIGGKLINKRKNNIKKNK